MGTRNIFNIDENIGHKITQIYLVVYSDLKLYEVERFKVTEGDKITYAQWIPVADFEHGHKTVYPNALIDLLKEIP